ncbi:MAG: hypothetical protein JWM74_2720 [Myxococcaceae bacterium]|nr:hypothetical protein [Myxococcaceae bacterium]
MRPVLSHSMQRFVLVLFVLATSLLGGCRSYEDVQDDARALRTEVAACKEGDECDVIDPPADDCTGVFSCRFAVNLARRAEAQSRSAGLAKESRSYDTCSRAFCAEVRSAHCDLARGRCVSEDGE